MSDIYVFWDNSNLFISAKKVAEERDGYGTREAVRLNFANLMRLATATRPVVKAFAVGSVPPEEEALWNRLTADTGIQIDLLERGQQSGCEQGVDESLQVNMLRAGDDEETPKVAVLLTGDGKGYAKGRGFLADLERLYKKGWGIEVLSWSHSCKPELKYFAQQNGEFISLDNYYNSITFIVGGRSSEYLSLTSRKTVNPRKSEKDLKIEALEEKLARIEAE